MSDLITRAKELLDKMDWRGENWPQKLDQCCSYALGHAPALLQDFIIAIEERDKEIERLNRVAEQAVKTLGKIKRGEFDHSSWPEDDTASDLARNCLNAEPVAAFLQDQANRGKEGQDAD